MEVDSPLELGHITSFEYAHRTAFPRTIASMERPDSTVEIVEAGDGYVLNRFIAELKREVGYGDESVGNTSNRTIVELKLD